ncbi:MAG: 3-oxoacyl-[acyl-carrier-protein] synthase III C-terminal domain-containing protein [Thermodesulfobacteriota bacterium]|nr:3-oxoacyl-[acyl-carrier-protein] synthase III C-terminal domain-containing protein [Thermodesulfobacteriota bacterium]
MVGITSYGAYLPIYRMSRELLTQVWGGPAGRGEKAVANFDEDTITMATEASIDAFSGMEHRADGLYFASTTPPYREKQCAGIIAAALDMPVDRECFTADFTNSLRAGTIALKAGWEAVKSGAAKRVIVAVADCRLPAPNSGYEPLFGDGAAAFILGDTDVAVEIEGVYTIYSEFMDGWRMERDTYLRTWEDRFIFEEGYDRHLTQAVKGLLNKYQLNKDDFSKCVVFAPDARRHAAMIKRLELEPEKVQEPLFDRVGHTGCALVPIMLAAALEGAVPGDKILMANYSDGADAFCLRVTEEIEKTRDRRGVKRHLDSKLMLPNYGKYLLFRDLMEWEAERRPTDISSLTALWRERNQFLRFHGGKCRQCSTIQHPIQRVCAVCQAKDDYEEVSLSNKRGNIISYAMDERAMVKDLPNVSCVIDLEGGGRYVGILTDREPEKVAVGMEVEMTLRNLHDGSGIHNYCWKPRPVRV